MAAGEWRGNQRTAKKALEWTGRDDDGGIADEAKKSPLMAAAGFWRGTTGTTGIDT